MKQKLEPLFFPTDAFMVRTPVLAAQDFLSIAESQSHQKALDLFNRTPVLQEAILAASPSFYSTLIRVKELSPKQKNHALSSLVRYISRMANRSTPFGIFSFVSIGKWDEQTEFFFSHNSIRKRARPDVSWITSALSEICEKNIPLDSILVKINPLAYETGGRICLNYYRNKESSNPKKKLSVRKTSLIELILSLSKNPITMEALESSLISTVPEINFERLQELIRDLLTKQILRLSIVPSLISPSIFDEFIRNVEKWFGKVEQIKQLQKISKKIDQYNILPMGDSKENLESLIGDMNQFIDIKVTPVQIDSSSSAHSITIHKALSEILQEASEVLWSLSYWKKNIDSLNTYYDQFLNKYGSSRLVPVKELLDENLGLGPPKTGKEKKENFPLPSEEESKYLTWLRRECEKSLYNQSKEIELDERFIQNLTKNIDKREAALSFDITCEVIAESSEAIDKGNYLLYAPYPNWEGGSTYGRFLDILGDEGINSIQSVVDLEQSHEPDAVFSDISFMPYDIRGGNVCIHRNLRKYIIDLDNPSDKNGKNIHLDQIYVGATEKRLFLYDKVSGKELIVHSHNVYNTELAPDIVRFLRQVSSERYANIYPFYWGELANATFLPRVRYKQVIFSLAEWNLDLDLLGIQNKKDYREIQEKFREWADHWDVPDYVFLTEGDQKILLNRKNQDQEKEVLLKVQRGHKVKLVEKLGSHGKSWICSSRGAHHSEFTFTFVKNPTYIRKESFVQKSLVISNKACQRLCFPGSQWLYLKLYCGKEGQDFFISDVLPPYIKGLMDRGIAEEFFYMRYVDPDPHLRVRLKGDSAVLSASLTDLSAWIKDNHSKKLLYRCEIATYERELERYGGEKLIEAAEKFFFYDSCTSIRLLQLISDRKLQIPKHIIGSLSIINILIEFGFKIEESIDFLSFSSQKKELEGFRKWKKDLVKFTRQMFSGTSEEEESNEVALLREAFAIRKEALNAYCQKIESSQMRIGIIESLIHMHCNRLLSVENPIEHKSRVYALQTLKTICYFNSKQTVSK